MSAEPGFICPFCGDQTAIISVRGHSQCSECHQVIETCCEGDSISRTAETKKPCKCGTSETGFCQCVNKTIARVGVTPEWACVKCGKKTNAQH
jgi:hypothetical protein